MLAEKPRIKWSALRYQQIFFWKPGQGLKKSMASASSPMVSQSKMPMFAMPLRGMPALALPILCGDGNVRPVSTEKSIKSIRGCERILPVAPTVNVMGPAVWHSSGLSASLLWLMRTRGRNMVTKPCLMGLHPKKKAVCVRWRLLKLLGRWGQVLLVVPHMRISMEQSSCLSRRGSPGNVRAW